MGLKKILKGIALAAFCLTIIGASYQTFSTYWDEKRFHPPGKLYKVAGYKMHLVAMGEGSPTVVLDAGMGCSCLDWSLVMPEIAQFSRVCCYDRAGYGWSEETPHKATSLHIAKQLHTLLKQAGLSPPYVLVGHSFGGINLRVFASRYPEEVAGIVLVDSPHEDHLEKLPTPSSFCRFPQLTTLFTYLGGMRLLSYTPGVQQAFEKYPESVKKMYRAQSFTNRCIRTIFKEMEAFDESLMQLKRGAGVLYDKPLTVITAGKPMSGEIAGVTQERMEALYRSFREFQEDLVFKSYKGKQLIAEESDHMITRNEPQIIVEAVREMVEGFKK